MNVKRQPSIALFAPRRAVRAAQQARLSDTRTIEGHCDMAIEPETHNRLDDTKTRSIEEHKDRAEARRERRARHQGFYLCRDVDPSGMPSGNGTGSASTTSHTPRHGGNEGARDQFTTDLPS